MSIKIKHILLLVLIILLSIIVLIVISYKKSISEYNNNVEAENVDKNYDMYYARGGDGWLEVCYLVAQKNGNWDNLFLSENFRKKYNEKDGILGDIQYDNIEYRPYAGSNEDYYFKEDMTYFVITQGKSKTVYIFHPVYLDNNQLDDVQFSEIIQLYDKNGKKFVIEGEIIDKEGFEYSFFKLCMGGDDEKRIAVTDNFHKKYPYFLDIFEHYSPLTFNHIEFIPDKSSWEKKEAYFIVDSELECKKRDYLVKFTLDKKGYLDDVETMKIKEEQYAGSNEACSAKIKYINSNWDNLKITDDFKKKFSPNKGIIPDIDNINIDIPIDGVSLKGDTDYICCFRDKNNNQITYLIKYIDSDDNLLDDVICEKLPYTNKTANEVRELYLKEYTDLERKKSGISTITTPDKFSLPTSNDTKAEGTFSWGSVKDEFPVEAGGEHAIGDKLHYFHYDSGANCFRHCECGQDPVTGAHDNCDFNNREFTVIWRKK